MEATRFSEVAEHVVDVLSKAGSHNDRPGIIARARELVRWQFRIIQRRRRIAATRAALEALDDRTLKDIGLSRPELRSVSSGTYGGIRAQRAQADFRQAA